MSAGGPPAFTHAGAGTPAAAWRARSEWGRIASWPAEGESYDRVVVVAAHPDDETLGAGALIAYAVSARWSVTVVVLTDGELSHPDSPTYDRAGLALRRRGEVAEAGRILGLVEPPVLVGYPDGRLADHVVAPGGDEADGVVDRLVALVGDGRGTLLVAPWRHDGHPDHDAAGRAAAVCAARTGAALLEYPVWSWHWAEPEEAPWGAFVALRVTPEAAERKVRAVGAHRTQVGPLSDRPGDETLLGTEVLAHFAGDREVYVRTTSKEESADTALDDLHDGDVDPWGAATSWYEERKRELLLSVLPARRFGRALEVGCSRGDLASALARRCGSVLAVDQSPRAVAVARERVPASVEVRRLDVATEWPEGRFDLVVFSEIGYFLSPGALERTLDDVAGCLEDGGVVVLCHWRHPVAGWPLDGPDVHERALESRLPPLAARYVDRDVEILVLTDDASWPSP